MREQWRVRDMVGTISVLSAFSGWKALDEEELAVMKTYSEELAFVDREDGLALEGAIISPATTERKPVAVLWIHGNTSRFYDYPYVQLGREVAGLGYTFITANTHGHDVISVIWDDKGGSTPGGACWERFDEVPLDIAPWIDLAVENGAKGVVLVGHSFGANKVAYYQAVRQDPRVLGVVCASGDVRWRADAERIALAEKMEAEGREDEILPPLEVSWYRMSVKTFLARARIAQHVLTSTEQTPYIAQIACPILAFYGTEEEWCGSQADLDEMRRHATAAARVDTHLIEGADHVYWGKADRAAELIGGWIDQLLAS
ncbi:MAG: alpha/beta fold hydrolase [Chloroflexia bacterium]